MTSPVSEPATGRVRSTRQKAAVDRALDELEDFVSAQELHGHLREAGERVSLATVYRTLQQRLDDGTVDVLRRGDGESVYRRCEAQGHHHHLLCRSCGATVELTAPAVERWAAAVAAEHGFTATDHTVEVTGLCAACTAESAEGSPAA